MLKQRYLLRDNQGNVVETPEQLFRRVAKNIAAADNNYGDFNPQESEETFFRMMSELEFLPNSPTLMNAGTPIQQLAACFVLPVEDNIPGIFESLKTAAIIQQTGGGTGFNFSGLRPRGDIVSTTKGVSSGPVSFIKIFDTPPDTMKQAANGAAPIWASSTLTTATSLNSSAAKKKRAGWKTSTSPSALPMTS